MDQTSGDAVPITFSADTQTLWIDWDKNATDSEPVELSLQSRSVEQNQGFQQQQQQQQPPWNPLDNILVRLTERLIIGFGGHTQDAFFFQAEDGIRDGDQ